MGKFVFEESRVVFEGFAFIVYDVSDKLPRHKNFPHGTDVVKPNGRRALPASWKYRQVPNRKIETLYCHQTAGSCVAEGYAALLNTFAFMARDPSYSESGKWRGTGRGWPGGAYTYFLPFKPEKHNGKEIIFQCWHHDWITWHSSDNHNSVAIVCQGYFKHPSMKSFRPKRGCPDGRPSDAQQVALMAFFYEYAQPIIGLSKMDIKGHCESPKPKTACPGTDIEKLYLQVRTSTALPEPLPWIPPLMPKVIGMLGLETWKERQAALVMLGHDLGKYGKGGNGVDGDAGHLTKAAVEAEEESLGLPVDGFWDDVFDYHVKLQLLVHGWVQEDLDRLI